MGKDVGINSQGSGDDAVRENAETAPGRAKAAPVARRRKGPLSTQERVRVQGRLGRQPFDTAVPSLESDFEDGPGTSPDAKPRVAFGVTVPAPLPKDEDLPAPPPRAAATPSAVEGADEEAKIGVPIRGDMIADRYRVVRSLGEGGMGQVFEVLHSRLGRAFALKLLHPRVQSDRNVRSAFFREAKYASTLGHPNLLSVLDYGEDSRFGAYMVAEIAEGEQLSSFLRERDRLSLRLACEIVRQLAEALEYIHKQHVIHCDIKPNNIMVSRVMRSGRRHYHAKILDFGLAQSRLSLKPGTVFGTPEYMAPELGRKEAPTTACDIYSLGVLFYELLTGKPPWSGTIGRILRGHAELEPTPIDEARGEEVDEALLSLVNKAMAKKAADRHESMSAFLYELRNVMSMLGFRNRGRRPSTIQSGRAGEQGFDRRALLMQSTFEALRIPLAALSKEGTILAANSAFSKFVLGLRKGLEGGLIQDTSLALVWDNLEEDLEAACAGESIGRRVEISVTDEDSIPLQMWLEPVAGGYAALSLYPERE